MKPAERPGIRTVTDAKALSAMANPFRSRMMDALKVDGPSTASALATRTGQAVGSASHHLKVLHEAGLVEEAPELARDRRERWWRLVDAGTRWSRADFADDTAAVTAAYAAEALVLQRQFERTQEWNANASSAPEWDAAAFATQNWLRLSPDELSDVANEIVDVLLRWSSRPVPDDGVDRESVYVFARGFPAQP
jgi:DNA-binding transcriptional ArsR family regulator